MSTDTPAESGSSEAGIGDAIESLIRDGRAVPEALIDRLREVRLREVEALRSLRPDEAEKRLSERVTAMEARLQAIEDGRAAGSEDLLGPTFELGERLRWLRWTSDLLTGQLSQDPLSFVDQDVDWVERATFSLRRWDANLVERADEIETDLESLRFLALERKLFRFLDDRDVPSASTPLGRAVVLWFAASESYKLESAFAERLAEEQEEESHEEARGADPSPGGDEAPEGSAASELMRLRSQRSEFIRRCGLAVEETDVEDRARFCLRVASDLIDRSSAVLTETAGAQSRRKVASLHSLRAEINSFFNLIGEERKTLIRNGAVPEEDRRTLRQRFRQLERLHRRTKHAAREEVVYLHLHRAFGVRAVRLWENVTFLVLLGFLGLVAADWWIEATANAMEGAGDLAGRERLLAWVPRLHLIDLVLCVFFQIDFFVRWGFASWRTWYFRSHFFFESLPALPYGLLLPYLQSVIIVRLVRLQRFLRLPVLLRSLRVFAFFVRGADRTVERFRGFLDRDIVFFDVRSFEDVPESHLHSRLLELEERHRRMVQHLYDELRWSDRPPILARQLRRLEVQLRFFSRLGLPYRRSTDASTQEIRLEEVIRRCLDCDVARSITYFGREGAERLARWLRFLDIPVFRRAPVIRRLIPASRLPDPSQAVSQAVRAAGQLLQEVLGLARFWGDVSGITTGPQILDRVASGMVVATKRPAVRLLLFGFLFAILSGLVELYGRGGFLSTAVGSVSRFLGTPIVILGSICLVVFGLGTWFKRIAGEALDAHLRTSDAHFYTLIKEWKKKRCRRDLRTLYRSVLLPERKLRLDSLEEPDSFEESRWVRFLAEPLLFDPETPAREVDVSDRWRSFTADRATILLYYRAFLDWPILHRDDDGTSVQLLGNLVLNDIRTQTLGLSRKELKKLERLNLEKAKTLSLGPYFWFRFITESLSIETAKLVIEYNSSCIPIDLAAFASDEQKRRFKEFLDARRAGGPSTYQRRAKRSKAPGADGLITDEFSSLNFLAPDAGRDEEVRRRFGDEVLDALKTDRKGVIRDVFGTRPYHLLPRNQRVFNPYRLYQKYLGGAKFLVLPIVLALGCLRIVFTAFRQIIQLVDEVLGGNRILRSQLSREASYEVAVRKINRMRKPLFMEALKLRASVDPEYLGLRIPGYETGSPGVTYQEDLDYIGAIEGERKPLDAMRKSALNDLRRFRLYLQGRGWLDASFRVLFRELDPSGELERHRGGVLRALATAYINDHQSLRSRLTATQVVKEFVESSLERKETWGFRLEAAILGCVSWFLPRNRRRRKLIAEYALRSDSRVKLSEEARRRLSRAFLFAGAEVEQAIALAVEASRKKESGEDCILEDLRRVARDHAAWTRKVITVRALQTITVLDIQSYRDLVWKLGAYEEESREHAAFRVVGRPDGGRDAASKSPEEKPAAPR